MQEILINPARARAGGVGLDVAPFLMDEEQIPKLTKSSHVSRHKAKKHTLRRWRTWCGEVQSPESRWFVG